MGPWLNKPELFECHLCGHEATRARVVADGDRWRCRHAPACQRRLSRMRSGKPAMRARR